MSFDISIVTVCYNSASTIERTIRSVFFQSETYSGTVQYVVIDGGSKDGTVELVASLACEAPTNVVMELASERDNGIYDAMNKGLSKANGRFIGIINSDDEYLPNVFATMTQVMNDNPSAELVHADVYWRYSMSGMPDKFSLWQGTENLGQLSKGMSVNHPTVFCRTTLYQREGVFDTSFKYVADWDWALRISQRGVRFLYVPQPWVVFDMGGVSNKFLWRRYAEILRVHSKLRDSGMIGISTFISSSFKLFLEICVSFLYTKTVPKACREKLRYERRRDEQLAIPVRGIL